MTQNWTKEPWSVGDACGRGICIHTRHSGLLLILDAVKDAKAPSGAVLRVAIRDAVDKGGLMRKVTEIGDPVAHPDLRRIVACVNAMEGMPADIEGLHVLTVLKAAEEMAKENERFRSALKRVVDALPVRADLYERAHYAEVMLDIATVALKEPT